MPDLRNSVPSETQPPLVQHSLQGVQVAVRDVQLCLEPVIPVAEGQEQTDGGQNGLGDGQNDLCEDGQLVSSWFSAAFMLPSFRLNRAGSVMLHWA